MKEILISIAFIVLVLLGTRYLIERAYREL